MESETQKNDGKKNEKATTEKSKAKKIEKDYVKLLTTERANLKQLSKRKFISLKAFKQILALLLFDKGRTMTEVMEELALSPQTLLKWRGAFEEKRMGSLLVFLEKKNDDDEKDNGVDPEKDELNSSE